ncbi:hypothetical protein BH24ACT4_BH24ACT4_14430 [soil metagenome]
MSRRLLRFAVLVGLLALVTAACGSDPVTDEPELVGVATVRDLEELPTADIEAPEVSGPREVRFRYETGACSPDDVPGLPAKVEATYTVDTVAIVVTPVEPDCTDVDDVAYTQGLEVFLAESVGDRDVSGSTGSR